MVTPHVDPTAPPPLRSGVATIVPLSVADCATIGLAALRELERGSATSLVLAQRLRERPPVGLPAERIGDLVVRAALDALADAALVQRDAKEPTRWCLTTGRRRGIGRLRQAAGA